MFSSKTDEWSTPQYFFDWCNKNWGPFTLDVCATLDNFKCPMFLCANSLEATWRGKCWMNPPYGRGIGAWVKKAAESAGASAELVCCLLPARTDTKWWHAHVQPVIDGKRPGAFHFVPGRLKFGGSKNSAPFPSVVVVFR